MMADFDNRVRSLGAKGGPPPPVRSVGDQLPRRQHQRRRRATTKVRQTLGMLRRAAEEGQLDLEFRWDPTMDQIVVIIRDQAGERVLRRISEQEASRLEEAMRAGHLRLLDKHA